MSTATTAPEKQSETTPAPEAPKAKGKGATPEQKAQATYEWLLSALNEIDAKLAADEAGPLMAKIAAAKFGESVSESGYVSKEAHRAFAFAASACKDIGLHLRVELASIAKAKATAKLSTKITDAEKLTKTVKRCVSHTGKLSAHDAGASLAIKFGQPAKLDGLF